VSTKTLNGNLHAAMAEDAGANHWRSNSVTSRSEQQSEQTFAEVAGSRPAPASGQQQLATAIRQIDALVKLNLVLREETALLVDALARASRFAYHDELTGLPNRRLLQDHFNQAVARAVRQHNHVVLLFLDLNRFKRINDAIGHLGGDRLLQQVAGRLTSCIRSSDTACRFGGDEFVVLLTDIGLRHQAAAATNKIIAQLAIPYVIDGTPIRMRASIGMATYPVDGKDYDELLRFADFTMYRNKVAAPQHGKLPKPHSLCDVRTADGCRPYAASSLTEPNEQKKPAQSKT
jgi:diguanylate cyclase (GGDEF)-like protein